MASEKSQAVYQELKKKGFHEALCKEIAFKYMNTDYTATRMLGYLYRLSNISEEMVIDEMIAILEDRERFRRKQEAESANASITKMYNERFLEETFSTIDYYNTNAKQFVSETENADMSESRDRFLSYIHQNGMILDWGCGSGRDSLAFKKAGYQVEAMDASEELCKLASQKTGLLVECKNFDDLDAEEKYDGIWACASLLHVEKGHLGEILKLAIKALKSNGVMYLSFKYGDFEGKRNGRYFTDMTEERFAEALQDIEVWEILEQWVTEDVRVDREDKWLNVLLRKTE